MPRVLHFALVITIAVNSILSPLFTKNSNRTAYAFGPQSPRPAGGPASQNLAAHEPGTLLVKFSPDAGAQSQYLLQTFGKKQQALRGPSGVTKLTLKDGLDVGKAMNLLREMAGAVEWVEPNYLVNRASAKAPSSSHSGKSAAPKLTSRGKHANISSNSTIIAVIDSGVDLNHRELKRLLWSNDAEKSGERLARNGQDDDHNGFVDDLSGWNFVADNGDVRDDIGHGTQVAGIIADAAGIRPEAATRIMPLKALDQSGTGTIADIVEAMDYAVARHVAVINCSFGTPGHSKALLEAVKRAEMAGIVVVAAAGNEGKDLSQSPFYPASFHTDQARNLISVAATEERKRGEVRLAGFSNFNADIAAPGTIRTTDLNNSHVDLTGTSAAAGSVTGAVARLKEARGWVSAQTIRDSLLKTAQESPSLLGALSKVSSRGSVNALAALAHFNRDDSSNRASKIKAQQRELSPAIEMAVRAGANLDTLRNNRPERPAPYQPVGRLPGSDQEGVERQGGHGGLRGETEFLTGSLPGANYDDPKPTITANYNAYLTELSKASNAAGTAGSQPMQSIDPTAGSASVGGFSYNLDSKNYNFMAPVMGLAGRAGLDLSLALSYNSNVWVRDAASNTVAFNADRGFPAPGWHIGFGAIQIHTNTTGVYSNGVTGQSSIIYIAPDGTRRDLAQIPNTTKYKTYDSSYIVFDAAAQIMYFPNGTQAKYGSDGYGNNGYSYDASNYDFQALPIEIKDRNGNFITIKYKTLNCGSNGLKTVIDYVTDTAGRRVDFNYQNNRLTSISQPRSGPGWTQPHWYVYIDYDPVTIQTNFSGGATTDPSTINGTVVYFPTRITYATGVNFRFSYTSYGQINNIEKWVPAITGQGVARKVARTWFDLPNDLYNFQIASPSFSNRYEWAENWNAGNAATYQYSYSYYNGVSNHEVIDPTYRKFQLATTQPIGGGWLQSLSVWAQNAGNWTKKDEATYTSDSNLSYPSNLRMTEIKKTANAGSGAVVKRATISYLLLDDMWLPQHKDEFVNGTTTLYRRTTTSYFSYPTRYILGLVKQTTVYNGSLAPLAGTVNHYDDSNGWQDSYGQTVSHFVNASGDGVIQHDDANYGVGLIERGNLSRVEQYSYVNGGLSGNRFVKLVSHDTNGNVRAEADALRNTKRILYTDNYSNKPSGITGQTGAYAYTIADPIGFRAGSLWDYFLGQPNRTFNLAPSSSTETQPSDITYDIADRPLRVTRPDGGWAQTDHWDNLLATVISTNVGGGNVAHKYEQFDGAGRTFKRGNDHPDGTTSKFSGQVIVSDIVGQVKDTSNVLAIDGNWAPAYEDASKSWTNPSQSQFTRLTRDELSRLKIITYADGNSKQVNYNGCGCAGSTETEEFDELGHKTITKTDFLGRLAEATEWDSTASDNVYSKASYSYDELDRLVRIEHRGRVNGGTIPVQNRYFTYDGYGRVQSEETPEGGLVSLTYTDNDLVKTVANQRNITVTNTYNPRNLLTGVSYSDGTPSVSFGYDDFGARTSMIDGEGATSYSYNSYRQLQSETRTFTAMPGNYYKLSYAYSLTGQSTQVNYGIYTLSGSTPIYSFNKNINYAYNSVSALSSIGTDLIGTNPNATTNVLSSSTYRAWGAENILIYGNGRRLTTGYHLQRPQLASMKVDLVSDPTQKILDYSYDYIHPTTGKNNNRLYKLTDHFDSGYTTNYIYDDYDRLIHAVSSASSSYFQYDSFNNITSYQGKTISYATNASTAPATNRISSAVDGSTTYTHTYDAAGNLTNDGQQAYAYDGANRLKEVNTGGQNTYGYDGDGLRVRKTEVGTALFYVRSSVLKNVAMEVNQSQGVVRAYVYSNGTPIAELSSDGNFYWVHKNHMGSGMRLTDSTGAMKFRQEYTPYGQVILNWSASSASNPSSRKFTGYERDAATGLDYARARMYGSNYGRFTTADPAGHKAADLENPLSLNRYAYVENDPVNWVDPSGHDRLLPGIGGAADCTNFILSWWDCSGGWWGGMEGLWPRTGGGGDGRGNSNQTDRLVLIPLPNVRAWLYSMQYDPSLTGGCDQFLGSLFAKVSSNTGRKPYSTSLVELAEEVSKQGGITLTPATYGGFPAGATGAGSIAEGNATITVSPRYELERFIRMYPYKVYNHQVLYTQIIAHELIHVAGGYADYDLALALHDLGHINDSVFNSLNPDPNDALGASIAWDSVLTKHCNFPLETR
jgi:RHS repeat-associated protein